MLDRDDPTLVGVYEDAFEKGPAIELVNGKALRILEPDPTLLDPEIIAHAISKLCRFTGHVSAFFSVAQHCHIVSYVVPEELALTGLLHDASEAFIGDISRPLKMLMDQLAPGVLAGIEDRLHEAIAERFGTIYPHPVEIKVGDNISLATEKRDLMSPTSAPWHNLPEPLPEQLRPWGPTEAARRWLDRFDELGGVY